MHALSPVAACADAPVLADPYALALRLAPRLRAEKAERLERAARAQVDAWVRERIELLACVDHEVRTPLASVMGYTEVLLSGDAGALTEEQSMMLERVAENGGRLLELMEHLLRATTAVLAQGRTVSLAEVVASVVGAGEETPVA